MNGQLSLRSTMRALPVFSTCPTAPSSDDAPTAPDHLFVRWFADAVDAGEPEPHAMTLSTCGLDDLPDARVLILKDLDAAGWWFATSSLSPKGRQLAARPGAALTFYWKTLARQVRVRGPVSPASRSASNRDFLDRSIGARAVALASRESEPLATRADCEAAVVAAQASLRADPALSADHWTLFVLAAEHVEFWQADPVRQHHRLRYQHTDTGWTHQLLWP